MKEELVALSDYDEFTKRVGYWAAIEKYQYAKRIDPSSAELADKKINLYVYSLHDSVLKYMGSYIDLLAFCRVDCFQ